MCGRDGVGGGSGDGDHCSVAGESAWAGGGGMQ